MKYYTIQFYTDIKTCRSIFFMQLTMSMSMADARNATVCPQIYAHKSMRS